MIGTLIFLNVVSLLSLQVIFEFSLIIWLKQQCSVNWDEYDVVESKNIVPISYRSDCWRGAIDSTPAPISNISTCAAGMAAEIQSCLADFGITGTQVVDQQKGPVITRYYLALPRGVRSSSVAHLDQDLSRALAVTAVRVVEQISGRTEVGLELPNDQRETVLFQDIIESSAYRQSQSPVTLVLGKSVSGDSVVADLSHQMPHLLVAGTTGSGKSMSLHAMILGMMLKSSPDRVRLILIDPKMLEFSCFEGVGHMLLPAVTEMNEATTALAWCVAEMQRRHGLMQASCARDLSREFKLLVH